MSLAIKYENVADANMRLKNTVVLYKGNPVFIHDVKLNEKKDDGIFRVLFTELPMKVGRYGEAIIDDAERKYISSKYFDIAPFPLGYVNGDNCAVFCSRLPNRMQKQGLSTENFHCVPGVPFAMLLKKQSFVDAVAGNYPSFDEALQKVLKDDALLSWAFHRDFCVAKDKALSFLTYLMHRGQKVGLVIDNEVTLKPSAKCLKESLDELGIRNRTYVKA